MPPNRPSVEIVAGYYRGGTAKTMKVTLYSQRKCVKEKLSAFPRTTQLIMLEPRYELTVSGISGTTMSISWSYPGVLLDSSVFRVF